ncbi:MAG TPA: hypothetical protein VHE78_09705 [Gemmatimonadaceae bacterium]|nr:hypothetical protein [Gemmatimonadaceae bacterium]
MKALLPFIAAAAATMLACADHQNPVAPGSIVDQKNVTEGARGSASISGTVSFVSDTTATSGGTITPLPNVVVNYLLGVETRVPADTGGSYVTYTYQPAGSVTTGASGEFMVNKLVPGLYAFRAVAPAGKVYLGGQTYVSVASNGSRSVRIYFTDR